MDLLIVPDVHEQQLAQGVIVHGSVPRVRLDSREYGDWLQNGTE